MKIQGIHFKNHKVLKNLKIDFTYNGKVRDLTVIAGANGSGKTNILKYIYDYFNNQDYYNYLKESLNIYYEEEEKKLFDKLGGYFFDALKSFEWYKNQNSNDISFLEVKNNLKIFPKIIYIPTEINFQNITTKTNMLKREYNFLNIVDSNLISNIASYIATRITYISNTEEDLTGKQVRERVAQEINGVFEILDLDIKFVGVSRDERSSPIFTNSLGEEFDINDLSSGEKQLFIRTLAIKMLEPENSILLIDEPEISLHPKWQQKIIEVYKRIGKNNQIIVATHSPHILGSVKKEEIILLVRGENKEIEVFDSQELNSSLGQTTDRILEEIMGLESTRNPEIYRKIVKLRELVDADLYEEEEFKKLFKELREILGDLDDDLILIQMDVKLKKKQLEKKGE